MRLYLPLILLCVLCSRLVAMDQVTAERVAVYCKVWGFLKYYHPGVATKAVNWDNAFLHHYPEVKQCTSKAQLNEILWMLYERVNAVEPAEEFEDDDSKNAGTPITDFTWLQDTSLFERRIRNLLWNLKKQGGSEKNFYAQTTKGSAASPGYPNVANDNGLYTIDAPSEPERTLALARYWNIINYYAPTRKLLGSSWDSLLIAFLPRVAEAPDSLQFLLAMLELSRKTYDGAAAVQSEGLINFTGDGVIPVELSFIEGQTVVVGGLQWAPRSDSLLAEVGLFSGDIIVSINGIPIEERRKAWLPYVTYSNDVARQFEISLRLLRGKSGDTARIVVDGYSSRREVVTTYRSYESIRALPANEKDPVVGNFTGDGSIAYINVSKFNREDNIRGVLEKLSGAHTLILDLRHGSTLMIAHYLTSEKRYVRVTEPNYRFPGFTQKGKPFYTGRHPSARPLYRGRIALLVNEETQAVGEVRAMALQAIPDVITFGSQTAGTAATSSSIFLPGKLKVNFSGLEYFYPDGTPTHRVGLKIDHEIRPTIKGIREGRDEVLEYALEYLEALEKDD